LIFCFVNVIGLSVFGGEIIKDIETIRKFLLELFQGKKLIGMTGWGSWVNLETPIVDLFAADIDGTDMCIGEPIEKEFGLESFGFHYGMANHSYGNLGDQKEAFYKKYPREKMQTLTVEEFAEMILDLIRIKEGLKLS